MTEQLRDIDYNGHVPTIQPETSQRSPLHPPPGSSEEFRAGWEGALIAMALRELEKIGPAAEDLRARIAAAT